MNPQERFEALYAAHASAVLSYVRRRIPADEADDVVADVFVVLWRRLDETPAEPLPWLLGIAHRILANRRRGAARATALRERLTTERSIASADPPGDDETSILAALATLSQRDQQVLLLIAWDGLTRAEAAEVLGISPGTLSVRLHRAVRRLTKALAKLEPAPDQTPAMEGS